MTEEQLFNETKKQANLLLDAEYTYLMHGWVYIKLIDNCDGFKTIKK